MISAATHRHAHLLAHLKRLFLSLSRAERGWPILASFVLAAASPVHAAWVATAWAPISADVYTLKPQFDVGAPKVLIGGSAFRGNGVQGRGIVRVDAATLDQDLSFTPDVTLGTGPSAEAGQVRAIEALPSGKIVIAGAFDHVNGVPRNNIARLNADGTLDAGFDPNVTVSFQGIKALARVDGDKLLVGGDFNQVGGVGRVNLARLNADGTLDTGFTPDPSIDNTVTVILRLNSARVLIGGLFSSTILALDGEAGTGSLDATFTPPTFGTLSWVNTIWRQADGNLLIGGSFGQVAGVNRNGLVALQSSGGMSPTQPPDTDGTVYSIVGSPLDSDQVMLVGGFSTFGGATYKGAAILTMFPSYAVDPSFTNVGLTHGGSGTYTALGLGNHSFLLGGSFARTDQQSRNRLSQIVNSPGPEQAPVTQALAGNNQATLTIDPQGSPGVTGFLVTCVPHGEGATVTVSGNGLGPLVVTGLTNDVYHECLGRSRNAQGDSPASAPASVTPSAPPAGAGAAVDVIAVPALSDWVLALLAMACAALGAMRTLKMARFH